MSERISVTAIICSAGKGARAGFEKNKLLVPFMGATALEKTLSAFDFPAIDEIIVSASKDDFDEISALCSKFARTSVVLGGATRTESVYNALKSATKDVVLIHDGARPFVTRAVIEGCIHSVKTKGSGVCSIPSTDTVAVVSADRIVEVPDRTALRQIQTPQGFFRENIAFAYERAQEKAKTYTDDSSVFADYCGAPVYCDGARENVKLTHPEDFALPVRVGFGVDTHAFGKAQDFVTLGGVKIPSDSELIAHSDGDVLVHALMDALLSSAGLKDIGHYFPDTDEKWKNADSLKMLETVVQMLTEKGLSPINVSVSVQAEKPRLSKYIDEMKNKIAGVLRIDPTAVGITAGTNEGLGYVGEGKGITVYAYVSVRRCN